MMKRSVLVLLLILFVSSVNAQAKQEVIASAGGYNVTGGLTLSWTLGETIIPTFTNGNLVLSHGFQQQLIVTAIEEHIDIAVNVKVYPNPASDVVNISFDEPVEGDISITVLDSQGKLVKKDMIEAAMTEKQINLQEIPAGVYYLRLTKGKLVNVYKVVKL